MKTMLILTLFASILAGCASNSSSTDATLPDGSKAKVNVSDNGMTVQGDSVNASVGEAAKVTDEDLHLIIYPGSKILNDKSMKVKTETEENALAYFTTTDDPAKVAKFYEEIMKGAKFSEYKSGESVNYILQKDNEDGSKHAIAITRKSPSEPVEISIGYGKETKAK